MNRRRTARKTPAVNGDGLRRNIHGSPSMNLCETKRRVPETLG